MKKIYINMPVKNQIIAVQFIVTFECLEYVFCECEKYPELRGFFTRSFLNENQYKPGGIL